MHKSTEWLQLVYLIKYHSVEVHGAWGWGGGLQRLWGVCVGGAWRPTRSVVTADHSVSALLKVASSSGFFKQGLVSI